MGLFGRLLGKKKSNDEQLEKQKADLLKFTESSVVNNNGCDQIQGAYGSFGITPTNPIPVNGIIGAMVYLFRLRSKTGVGFYYHRLGNVSSPTSINPIDHYELVAADASEWCDLFFDCYYPRRSAKAPNGFTLLPWNSFDDQLKIMAKLPMNGVNNKIDNFPYGLPDVMETNRVLNDSIPGLGSAVAKKILIQLNEYKGKWERKGPYFKNQSVNKITIKMHLAEYLAFLMHFFTDYKNIQAKFKFKNEPSNLNGLIDFAFFLDLITNHPDIFIEQKTVDINDIIHRFIKDSINSIPGLSKDFEETRMLQATERVKLYSQLLNDDLNNPDTCNYQSIREFLKEVFSGKIAEEEQVVIINILHRELSAIKSLIMMKRTSSSVKNIIQDKFDIACPKSDDINNEKPMTEEDYYRMGRQACDTGKYEEALKYFNQVLTIIPDNSKVYYCIGDVYERLKDYERSMFYTNKAIELNPTWYLPYGLRGELEMEFSQFDNAISDFSKAIELNPEDVDSYFDRSLVYEIKGEYDKAKEDLLCLLKIKPNDEDAKENLQQINKKIQKNKKEIGTCELGEKYCKLFVLDKTKAFFDQTDLIQKLQIIKNPDSIRELNILNIFSIVNQIGRISIKNDIKDSVINHVVNSYLNFIIKDANKNNIDEEIKLNEINKTEALIPKRVRQYATILNKYEASILKNDSTKDNRTEMEIMDDLMKILGHITSRRDSEKDIFLGMSLFSIFMTLTSDNFMEEAINKDLSMYDIKNSELDDAVQDSVKNDFVLTKQDGGRICITKK